MTVEVLIPFASNDPYRRGAHRIVKDYYRTFFPGLLMTGVHGADVCKADGINAAVEASTADVLVLNDADSLVLPWRLMEAIAAAEEQPGLVFAYTVYRRLSKLASERIEYPMQVFHWLPGDVEWEKELSGSHGCVAIRRECFLEAGGLDPAFGMAGYEDLAFNTVCEAFWPSRRVDGELLHLWHPRGWDADPAREAANLKRYRDRYLEHWGDREALLAVRNGSA